MKKLFLAAALAVSASAYATEATKTESTLAINPIQQSLANLGLSVNDITDSPIPGLKTVITDRGVFYSSPDGRYLMQGALIDVPNRKNLTEDALSGVRKEGLKDYQDSMIVYKAENEKHQVTIFTDITCGYCRKLHRELDDYLNAGITVKYMAFPRGGLQSQGYEDLMNVWCAKDAATALTEAKAGNPVDDVKDCSAPVAEHYQLGQKFGISGTPAIILEDGSIIPGYQPAAELAGALERNAKS
ncbi:bifunctional protein-disulfide isomerase/oxidoreductase DsbC [Pseudoalteromonas luteoviolacea]|uniref:bifunctional protein-disulfide isomerase/oxidoreductase DsbC n=1 Tax=Pseudoalteromonas luteoviolacea TaxID=43657 RepID=UPI001B36605C|nr:bifunctional protein-disulfide isomerase/oxidoreductase DsbC [Pseudoalteromonas luteoviolacea]MBQ4813611.1 bifunctional protein-disulfide isomerase/oxidoreductase DsbC [Pseudoalteromonas luteoviolacea]